MQFGKHLRSLKLFFPSGIWSCSVCRLSYFHLKWEKSLVDVEAKASLGERTWHKHPSAVLPPAPWLYFVRVSQLQAQPMRLSLPICTKQPSFAAVWTMLLSHLQKTNLNFVSHWLLYVHGEEGGWDVSEMTFESGKCSEKPLLILLFREQKTKQALVLRTGGNKIKLDHLWIAQCLPSHQLQEDTGRWADYMQKRVIWK